MKFCEECGAALEDNAMFCEECGNAVADEVQTNKVLTEDKPISQKEPVPTKTVGDSKEGKKPFATGIVAAIIVTFFVTTVVAVLIGVFIVNVGKSKKVYRDDAQNQSTAGFENIENKTEDNRIPGDDILEGDTMGNAGLDATDKIPLGTYCQNDEFYVRQIVIEKVVGDVIALSFWCDSLSRGTTVNALVAGNLQESDNPDYQYMLNETYLDSWGNILEVTLYIDCEKGTIFATTNDIYIDPEADELLAVLYLDGTFYQD